MESVTYYLEKADLFKYQQINQSKGITKTISHREKVRCFQSGACCINTVYLIDKKFKEQSSKKVQQHSVR